MLDNTNATYYAWLGRNGYYVRLRHQSHDEDEWSTGVKIKKRG
jgi:hypothetical protein